MNILFLTQVLPYPLDAGPKIRAYYVLRHLAQRHNITLVSFTRPSDTQDAIAHLRTLCAEVHCVPMVRSRVRDIIQYAKSLLARRSFLIQRDWSPAMAQLLSRLVDGETRFDAVHADQLWMAPYALWVRSAALQARNHGAEIPFLVLDQHNAVYMIAQRLADRAGNPLARHLFLHEARCLAEFEVDICRRFERVTWVTEDDYVAIQKAAGSMAGTIPKSDVIPICVAPDEHAAGPTQGPKRRVTFIGGLHYPPNAKGALWFAGEVFPTILRSVPDAVLTVIGKNPPRQLRQLGIPAGNLDAPGYVADPRSYFEESAVAIVPILAGGGMRVKILDAWTQGIPVVSTTIGAEGIRTQPGVDILIADTADEFAQAVIALLNAPARAQQMAEQALRSVQHHYNWKTQYQAWDPIYTRPDNLLPA